MSTPEATSEPIRVDSEAEFEDLIASGGVVLVDYYADWCGPCKMLEPTIEELAAETDAVVAKVDIDEHQSLARSRGVRSVPTLEFFVDGESAERVVGVQEKDKLASIIDDLA